MSPLHSHFTDKKAPWLSGINGSTFKYTSLATTGFSTSPAYWRQGWELAPAHWSKRVSNLLGLLDYFCLLIKMPWLLPYFELISLFISLVSKKTAGFSNCRGSFSHKDHVLDGHVMLTLKNKRFESCTFSCELESQCFSVNYIASHKTCQLNNVSKDFFPGDFVLRKGAIYIDMVIREYHPCMSMRCENGGTCVARPSVMCKCLDGFSGLRCESKLPQALGMESGTIPDSNIETSSKTKKGFDAWKARLNENSCWMPAQDKNTEYIKVTFTSMKNVTAIATQGAPNNECWVKSFTLQWFNGNNLLTGYKTYQANVDKNSVVTNKLAAPIQATFIRIQPQTWSACIAMRLEVYGY